MKNKQPNFFKEGIVKTIKFPEPLFRTETYDELKSAVFAERNSEDCNFGQTGYYLEKNGKIYFNPHGEMFKLILNAKQLFFGPVANRPEFCKQNP